jgi:hypothetical protein
VDRHSPLDFSRQSGRCADEDRDLVAGSERLMQHVPTERSGCAQNQDSRHYQAPGTEKIRTLLTARVTMEHSPGSATSAQIPLAPERLQSIIMMPS